MASFCTPLPLYGLFPHLFLPLIASFSLLLLWPLSRFLSCGLFPVLSLILFLSSPLLFRPLPLLFSSTSLPLCFPLSSRLLLSFSSLYELFSFLLFLLLFTSRISLLFFISSFVALYPPSRCYSPSFSLMFPLFLFPVSSFYCFLLFLFWRLSLLSFSSSSPSFSCCVLVFFALFIVLYFYRHPFPPLLSSSPFAPVFFFQSHLWFCFVVFLSLLSLFLRVTTIYYFSSSQFLLFSTSPLSVLPLSYSVACSHPALPLPAFFFFYLILIFLPLPFIFIPSLPLPKSLSHSLPLSFFTLSHLPPVFKGLRSSCSWWE